MNLTIAVLTGRRPALLERTLTAFTDHHPEVWGSAVRCVMHNTGDDATRQVLDRYDWDLRHTTNGRLLPIGEASQILGQQVEEAGTEFVMRLEDDWEAHPVDWWEDAVQLLDTAGQVRLRRHDEKVMGRCAVCRNQMLWVEQDGHRVTKDAHYTHNPSLMRTELFLTLFPYRDERDAGRKFHGQPAAQHVPGVFSHLGGDGKSLKKNGGRR